MTTATDRIAPRAIAWVVEHSHAFAPASAVASDTELVRLGELGLFAHLLERAAGRPQDIERCRETLVAACANAPFEATLRGDPRTAPVAWMLVRLGLNAAAPAPLRAFCESIALGPNVLATERLPHRHLELLWLLDALNFPANAHAWDDAYRTTFLARYGGLHGAQACDAYAVTHAVAYLTDFGARRIGENARHEKAATAVAELLPLALSWKNFDLMAELLAAKHWLHITDEELGHRPWDQLAAQQLASGALFAAPLDAGLAAELARTESQAVFQLLYHTTLVTSLTAL